MAKSTRTRQATHGTLLVRGVLCPTCRSSRVLRAVSKIRMQNGDVWCGACGAEFWAKDADAAVVQAAWLQRGVVS